MPRRKTSPPRTNRTRRAQTKKAVKKKVARKKTPSRKSPNKATVTKPLKQEPGRLVVFNWKMNPSALGSARSIFDDLKERSTKLKRTSVVACPSTLHLSDLVGSYRGKKIEFGVQDAFYEDGGAWTGEISFAQAHSLGTSYALVNHSERKKIGEGPDIALKKLHAALRNGMKVVLCVGEASRDDHGTHFESVEKEILFFLKDTSQHLDRIILAYEPIWAIGKSGKEAATPHDLHEMVLFIRKLLIERVGRDRAYALKMLYGGSVDKSNVAPLFETGVIDGFLVGRASLDKVEFGAILDTLEAL
jgi:triosephosphate isomerase (TIM)